MRALRTSVACVVAMMLSGIVTAQQPTPPMVVVPAAGATSAPPAPTAAPASSDAAISAAIKVLEQTKAANDALLKKQEAILQQLDELQKAAEQLKTFSKRV
ncbi:MAG TPA: hypothetical protein VJ719_02380 [Chthoniobacterales bacterium]|nr:hypothetical protein [Chthoniobacterales bacterium]